jgi:fungalysin metallopeptidase (M36)
MYYDGEIIVVGAKIVSETDGIYREYTERALNETKPGIWDSVNWKATGLFSGIADYFPCSYQGNPKFGSKYVEILGDKLPAEFRNRGYLRNMANNRPFVGDSADLREQEMHALGEVWAGVLWELREMLGCKPDSSKCLASDKIVFESWNGFKLEPTENLDKRFEQELVQRVEEAFGAAEAGEIREAFTRRGLALRP